MHTGHHFWESRWALAGTVKNSERAGVLACLLLLRLLSPLTQSRPPSLPTKINPIKRTSQACLCTNLIEIGLH